MIPSLWFQISIRSDALMLFDLREDELLPDLHITRAGVFAGLGAHQEHLVDHNAQTADRNKVPAEVISVAPHEVASDSGDDESSIATSDSQGRAAVKVTPQITTLPPHHWLQTWNNMSSCKLPTRQSE